MTGRPSKFTPELFEAICERMAQGEPLAAICRDEGMPHPSTVRDWANADEALSRRFGRAREDGEDAIAQQCLEIADDSSGDVVMGKNGPTMDAEFVARSRIRVETRLKLLAKFNPKRWGDKLELAGNAEQPLTVLVQRKAGEPESTP